MDKNTANKGRMVPVLSDYLQITCTIISGILSLFTPVPGISLPVIATFTCSCQKEGQMQKMATFNLSWETDTPKPCMQKLAVFCFNADSLGYLDSYQEIKGPVGDNIRIASTGGQKRIILCANTKLTTEQISSIHTVYDLEECFCMLEDLHQSSPLMLGEIETKAGNGIQTIRMKPMTSEIELRSVCCSFTGTPYEGECIQDARLYLINVNAQCSLLESSQDIRRLVNIGMLNEAEMKRFKDPGIIVQEIGQVIGEKVINKRFRFLCFHNMSSSESPGSPFTRLVLEGRIQGETYYWPLTINRSNGGRGVSRNSRHVFDLKIRRKGSLDPDTEISIEACETLMEVKEWKEKEEYAVCF